ncbi:COMM domain-containing protein 2 [Geodia barretti]|uniref:COMM domain-containing protein 2 n=1 Tax=Geodia barretti TaxID=519541 RepID=A0AA35WGA9_GEOBA|nr:COMM domain-containing protein 2 [Geodia barretti]
MLLVLSEEHKVHLGFLTQVDVEVVKEFCKISLEFIRRGTNPKLYQSAGQKLEVDPQTVQHGVEGLMYLITECSKLMVSEIDFLDSIMVLGFSEELNQHLLKLYQENCHEVRAILSQMTMDLPHYHNLEWRLDVQLASRSLQQQADPSLTLRLHTKDNGVMRQQNLQTDPANLQHITKSLETALSELSSQYCRRIMRNIK